MSFLTTVKDMGFGRPFNGMPFNEPIIDSTNPGPIDLNLTDGSTGVFNTQDGTGLFLTGRHPGKFTYTGNASSLIAYMKCPPLSALINMKAQAHINGKMYVMNKDGQESTSKEAKAIRTLFRKPNPIQSWHQFDAQQKIYIQLFGFCIVLPIIPAGFESYGPIAASSLWNIPPYMIDITETEKLFYQTDLGGIIKSIKLSYKGNVTDLPTKNLGIFKDFTPSFNTLVFPESRVALVEKPINNIMAALESENEIISYAGSQGIISPDTGGGQYVPISLSEPEKLQLQADFRRQYGIRSGQFRYIISPAAIKWQSMGTDAKKLLLIEFIAENTVDICNEYNVAPFLMGLRDSTYNNQNSAGKALYENAVIPEAQSMDEEWINFFRLPEGGDIIEKNFDHLSILQEDKEQAARALKANTDAAHIQFFDNLITYNEYRVMIGQDTIPGMDKFYKDLLAEGWSFGQQKPAPDPNAADPNADPNKPKPEA